MSLASGGNGVSGDALAAGTPLIIGAAYAAGSRASANSAADTTLQTLQTITIPGGIMGSAGRLTFHAAVAATSSANVKTMRIELNGVQASQDYTASTSASCADLSFRVWNKGVENANEYFRGGAPNDNGTTLSPTALGIDTTQDFTLTFRAAWSAATAGETISLLHSHVLIEPGF